MKQITDERELRRIIAVDSERERGLLSLVSSVRRELHELELPREPLADQRVQESKQFKQALERTRQERAAHIADLKTQLAAAERELSEITPRLADAHRRIGEITKKADTDRRANIASIVQAAADGATSREAFLSERAKLSDLRAQLTTAEKELHSLQSGPPKAEATPESRARELLETGDLELVNSDADIGKRVKRLIADIQTLYAAVKLQQGRVHAAQQTFGCELAAALKSAVGRIVAQIATSVQAARDATLEAQLLRTAFVVACGGDHDETLGAFTFPGIPVPATGQYDQFATWLDSMRRAGLL